MPDAALSAIVHTLDLYFRVSMYGDKLWWNYLLNFKFS